MISEKTVELNLTTELINHISARLNYPCFALAPSQRQEARFPVDAGVGMPGFAIFVQYKRAETETTGYCYKLNRTAQRDQHLRLQALETAGVPVFYALPLFHLPVHVAAGRRCLLLMTAWFRPLEITLPGNQIGHHEVHFDAATSSWSVSSKQRVPLPAPASFADVRQKILNPSEAFAFPTALRAYRTVVGGELSFTESAPRFVGKAKEDFSRNQILFGFDPDHG